MSTGTILDKIIARKQEEIAVGKNNYTLGELEAMADNERKARGFIASLFDRVRDHQPAVIAEIKKASPSKGVPCAAPAGSPRCGRRAGSVHPPGRSPCR